MNGKATVAGYFATVRSLTQDPVLLTAVDAAEAKMDRPLTYEDQP